MKTRILFRIPIAVILALAACKDSVPVPVPEFRTSQSRPDKSPVQPQTQSTDCMVSLLGDKDGFGMGLPEKGTLALEAGNHLPLDFRLQNDPKFTDLYSADMTDGQSSSHLIIYTHTFSSIPKSIEKAILHLNTLGIQDGDSQVYGSNTDIKLFLDGEEVPGAFDSVDQFDLINGAWSDFCSLVDIEIPASLYHVLTDGKVEVRWEMYQLNTNCASSDSFAIDYSELQICAANKQ